MSILKIKIRKIIKIKNTIYGVFLFNLNIDDLLNKDIRELEPTLTRGYIASKNKAKESECIFAVVLKENGKVIGEIEAHPESSQPDKTENYALDTFSPCWMLNKNYHGMGYAYEAAKAFFNYLFNEKGARRIYAYTEDYNIASQKICEKLGMRREGLFKEFVSFVNDENGNPTYENTYQYAILKKEWNQFDQ